LKDTVILPIKKKYLFENSRLLQPPKGRKELLIYMMVFKKKKKKKNSYNYSESKEEACCQSRVQPVGLMPGKTLRFFLFSDCEMKF